MFCLDADTGRVIWEEPIEGELEERQGGDGPRATPTLDDGRVYILGAPGEGPRPALLLFHPYGSDPAQFAQRFRAFAESRGMVVIAPCGTRLLAPDRWAFAVSSEDLIDRFRMDHREAAKALQKARDRFPID